MWVLIQAWFKLNSIVLFCGRRNSEMTENVNLATLITIDTPVLSEQATLKHTTFEQNLSFPHIYCSHQFLLVMRQQHSSSVRSLQTDTWVWSCTYTYTVTLTSIWSQECVSTYRLCLIDICLTFWTPVWVSDFAYVSSLLTSCFSSNTHTDLTAESPG